MLSLSKGDEMMNKWTLYKSEEIAETAVETAGVPLGWWEKSSRIYPLIATLACKYFAVQTAYFPTRLSRRRTYQYQETQSIVWAGKGWMRATMIEVHHVFV